MTRSYLDPSPPSSVSSSDSFLSTSSSLSTFSDISVTSVVSIPSPQTSSNSKTYAFFASPFSTRPPTPPTPPQPPAKTVLTPTIQVQLIDSSNEPTPRPPNLEPTLSQLWPPPQEPIHHDPEDPHPGSVITDTDDDAPSTSLRLVRPLGHGAFSSVWLADDLSPLPLILRSRRSLRDLRTKSSSSPTSSSFSLSRAGSLRKLRARLPGTRPTQARSVYLHHPDPPHDKPILSPSLSRASSASSAFSTRSLTIAIEEPDTPPALSRTPSAKGRLVAVKMTVRGSAAVHADSDAQRAESEREKERTRVAFVREVEVLRHISHPNITPLLTHLSTPTHHLLVLPFLPGGDLLALVNSDLAWPRLRESVLQRIWAELCKAVAWMHSVGLVHRDIKLENILLTTPIYTTLTASSHAPRLADLPAHPAPLVKLTDFGLSRFVDIRTPEERRAQRGAGNGNSNGNGSGSGDSESESEGEDEGPLLSTRCGSEAYAAPELVMGSGGGAKGVYDARETDAWACGVVLYALVGRRLPFGEGVGAGAGAVIGGGAGGGAGGRVLGRRHWLMTIARGEYEWPEHGPVVPDGEGEEDEELVGRRLVESAGARRMVGRLLVRDPRKRAKLAELWGDAWMGGGDKRGGEEEEEGVGEEQEQVEVEEMGVVGEEEDMDIEEELELALREEESIVEEGWLVDQEGIGAIARKEVV